MLEKKKMTGLFRSDPATPEGKYLVKRRDGTVVEWPSFVLGARDPNAADALRFYGLLNLLPTEERGTEVEYLYDMIEDWLGNKNAENKEYVRDVFAWADRWDEYRKEHGDGDPLMGRHREDDPATIEEMRRGQNA